MKTVQYFTTEYLQRCKQMNTLEVLQFLEEFRLLFAAQAAAQMSNEAEPPEIRDPAPEYKA